MFLARRPSPAAIDRFLRESRDAPLSYGPIGLVTADAPGHALDRATVVIGRGAADFARARSALMAWKQFDVGWVETFPRDAPVEAGTVVLFEVLLDPPARRAPRNLTRGVCVI